MDRRDTPFPLQHPQVLGRNSELLSGFADIADFRLITFHDHMLAQQNSTAEGKKSYYVKVSFCQVL